MVVYTGFTRDFEGLTSSWDERHDTVLLPFS